jgi:hypothetical protein
MPASKASMLFSPDGATALIGEEEDGEGTMWRAPRHAGAA